ncbi:MAG: hypothetical protein HFG38_02810 [Eubacterium sp.]|jgi:hypothetical protein|nr:hypothetical protein [Eubacterium sp.]
MSLLQKKIILIVSGIVILLVTFFLVFQKNQETVYTLEAESRNFQNQVNHLSSLQTQVTRMSKLAPQKKKETDTFTGEFLCRVPQQKAIHNLYLMMKKSGIRINAITPGDPQTFFQDGKFLVGNEGAAASTSAVEANPENKVDMIQMVGKRSVYDVQLTGTLSQIMKAIDWVAASKEHMTVWNVNLSYDASTGKLSGNITIAFNELNGNGKPYEEPDVSDISVGIDEMNKMFGTAKK